MRRFVTPLLIAALAVPALTAPAVAQSRAEIERSRRDVREERRDLRDAYRHGDRRDVREARRDVRQAERRLDRDIRDHRYGRNDWRDWRSRNRTLYARGNWRAPFRYNAWRPGVRIAPVYYGQRYWLNDPYRYRLPAAGPHQRWVRHYDDVVLIDQRRGIVVDVIRGFFW